MKFEQAVFDGIKQAIEEHSSMVITTHTNPDGDAVGSSLALATILRSLGKEATVILPNDCPLYLKWISGYDSILLFDKHNEKSKEAIRKADLIFCLDYNNLSRLEEMGEEIANSSAPKILIDHHPYPTDGFLHSVHSIEVCSTCELVFETILACDYEKHMTKEIAEALYTGIITDTGGLQHNSSRPELYMSIAKLMSYGIDKNFIHEKIFNVYSYDRMKLLGHILKDNFVFLPEYKSAYMYITVKNQKQYNFQLGDSEGMVNMPLAANDIKFCALFTEYPNKMVKVSFRSKGDFPANEFSAKFFNGGGHRNAAGGRVFTSLKEALRIFEDGLPEFKQQLLEM